MTFFPAKNLDPQLPREGITKRKLSHARFDPSLALGIKGKGGFGEFRAWGGMNSGRVRERAGDDK